MDFKQLETFCAIAKYKSYSKAAEHLFLTQPTLSSHIINLEKELKTTLVNRSSKQISLTPAGQILYQYAVDLLSLKTNAQFKLDEYRGTFVGQVEIAASTIPEQYVLPELLCQFHQEYPDVTLSMHHLPSEKIIEGVLSEEYNLGIVGSRSTHNHLAFHELVTDELALITPASEKYRRFSETLTWSDLISLPYIFREQGSGTRKRFETALKRSHHTLKDLRVVAYIENTEVIKTCIRKGMGVSILSRRAVEQELMEGLFYAFDIPDLELHRHFYLVHHKYRSLSPLEVRFRDFLIEALRHQAT
ncbi:selenium metabolism-associated LysR family transcriptional regulator [Anoxynatronum buryatiense]|uniref:DNA-binding transcriptional regulator, LysR family n=1 Tax=Anoxynatronum buryatiense TaxID=489973 RepID=A0AA46AJR4_9CLOT|nr:selenium metabolism-associated LysR family transcriptional regulator [Anoxynatronum buryatiense]SMP64977.1 DNA-binding transcriptional regulator, LysR family [Anoxynatronum buryatiense]